MPGSKGTNGARYIVCNQTPISTGQIVKIAQQRTEQGLGLHVIPSEQAIRDTITYELNRDREPAPTTVAAGTS